MAATPALTYDALRRQITSRSFAPVYLLHGEEGFFIDELIKLFENSMPEADREFNMYVLYAAETQAADVINRCQAYPMMSDRIIVILKEAQVWDTREFTKLAAYLNHPMPSTVLVVASRGKAVKNKELTSGITALRGVSFESKKLRENNVGPIVEKLLKERNLNIEPKGLAMFCDYVGTDISRLYNQIEKMAVVLQPGAMVTPEVIERNIGISKDYNSFEFRDAIFARDAAKAIRIIEHFRSNPKVNPAIPVLAALFSSFSDLVVYEFMKDKSPGNVMGALGLKWQSQIAFLERAARVYNARKTIEIISLIRIADRQMKGVGSRQDAYDILRNLVFAIMNCRGI